VQDITQTGKLPAHSLAVQAAANPGLTEGFNVHTLKSLMTPRQRYGFWIDPEQRDGLRFVKERDGILESEQIRRAINEWLKKKGVQVKSERKRAATRKRP